ATTARQRAHPPAPASARSVTITRTHRRLRPGRLLMSCSPGGSLAGEARDERPLSFALSGAGDFRTGRGIGFEESGRGIRLPGFSACLGIGIGICSGAVVERIKWTTGM